ncbi:MAG: hypothetical protein F6K34_28195 [Okeania sp. SIO4D6]|nr:hypothetical protein [Okeania sp. SIO4D6]NEP93837.1 hypothetical protein [Okeania sp. SIO2F5]
MTMALLHESSVLNIHSAAISLCLGIIDVLFIKITWVAQPRFDWRNIFGELLKSWLQITSDLGTSDFVNYCPIVMTL